MAEYGRPKLAGAAVLRPRKVEPPGAKLHSGKLHIHIAVFGQSISYMQFDLEGFEIQGYILLNINLKDLFSERCHRQVQIIRRW